MSRILQLFFLALITSGCFSIRVPLNVPPKTHHFSENASDKVTNSQIDSSKSSISTPIILLGGIGYTLGVASYSGGSSQPSVREKLKSSNALVSSSIGAMIGLVVGHRQWKKRVTVQSAEGYAEIDTVDSSESNPPKSLMKSTLVGTSVGYALGSLINGGRSSNFSTEAWISKGSFVGGMLGAGYGNLLTRLSNNGAFKRTPKEQLLSKNAERRRMPKKVVLIPGMFGGFFGGYIGDLLVQERNDYYSGPPSFSSRFGGVVEGTIVGAMIGSATGITLYGIKSIFKRPKKTKK